MVWEYESWFQDLVSPLSNTIEEVEQKEWFICSLLPHLCTLLL